MHRVLATSAAHAPLWLGALALTLALVGCVQDEPSQSPIATLDANLAFPPVLLPTTTVAITTSVTESPDAEWSVGFFASASESEAGGSMKPVSRVAESWPPRFAFGDALCGGTIAQASRALHWRVDRRTAAGDFARAQGVVSVACARTIAPSWDGVAPASLSTGTASTLPGAAGALWPSEGVTKLVFAGEWTPADPAGAAVDWPRYEIALHTADDAARQIPAVLPPPEWVPPTSGVLKGELWIENAHTTGEVTASPRMPCRSVTAPAALTGVTPSDSVRRGGWLHWTGQGLVAPGLFPGQSGAVTHVQLAGTFQPDREGAELIEWTGDQAWSLPASVGTEGVSLSTAVRPRPTEAGRLEGFGAEPGQFTGSAIPITTWNGEPFAGAPLAVQFEVVRTRQWVVVERVADWSDAIERFGLGARDDELYARILERAARPYHGVAVEFVEVAPAEQAEYTVVELRGSDPNGQALLGLDNTEGKDVGNLRLDDVLGGFNPTLERQGLYAYGGVFVDSFLSFSPTLGLAQSPISDPRFDAIFEPVLPELGGIPAELADHVGSAAREAEIQLAIDTLAELLGGTIAHELGHALGLTAESAQFHNEGDHPRWIMDAGLSRPFGERAGLAGEGPEEFSPTNHAYLQAILPEGINP